MKGRMTRNPQKRLETPVTPSCFAEFLMFQLRQPQTLQLDPEVQSRMPQTLALNFARLDLRSQDLSVVAVFLQMKSLEVKRASARVNLVVVTVAVT